MSKRIRHHRELLAAAVLAAALHAPAADAGDEARAILDAAGASGGLIVHVGCGAGRTTAKLADGGRFLVQGLTADAAKVPAAREAVRKAGTYGAVSISAFDGRRLPYIDNLANVVVLDRAGDVTADEALRVLAPGGVLCRRAGGKWTARRKPRPDGIDDWTHFLHGPGNNAVADDEKVAPPQGMQWLAGPRYARHHDRMSSVSASVSAGGRVFTILDEAPDVSILTPPEWNLVARDAFNGLLLWRRPIAEWFHHLHGLKSGPAHLPRKLVAVGDRVYVTLKIEGKVHALDAATGETVRTYEQTAGTSEIVCEGGALFLCRTGAPALLAVEADSGKLLWKHDGPVLRGTLGVGGGRAVFFADDRIVALDRATGEPLWRSEPVPRAKSYPLRFTPTLVLAGDVVLFAGGEFAAKGNRSWKVDKPDTLTALDAATGKRLWTADHPLSGYASSEDLLVIDGVAWYGETTSGHAVGTVTGRDVRTGKVVSEFDPDVKTYWFHHRCYRSKATTNYLLTSRTGVEFVDVAEKSWSVNHWVRGACLYGVMPANGLLYAPQHPCACFPEAKLSGFSALAGTPAERDDTPPAERLARGPACDTPPAKPDADPADWPTYRRDSARSGRAGSPVPANVRPAWSVELGGRLSSLVAADGRLFVAQVDAHAVHAISAEDGKALWRFTADGRVDSPPTVWRGRVIFGSADGCIYCLRADDGELVWRFRAAPGPGRLVDCGRVESVWPVHGSVLVRDGVAWAVAGRSRFLDGGMWLYRLDAAGGRVLSTTRLGRQVPEGKAVQDYARQHNMPVSLPDILSADGKGVYMRSQVFGPEGRPAPLEALPYKGNPERYSIPVTQQPDRAHLFSPTGFLDDTYWHRTYWVYGSRFLGGWAGYSQAGRVTPSGKILCFDDTKVYGFGRKGNFYRWTTPIEHHLWAAPRPDADAPPVPQPAPAKRKAGKRRRRGRGVAHYWQHDLPLIPRAMCLAGDAIFLAGPRDLVDETKIGRRVDEPQNRKLLAAQDAANRGKAGGLFYVAARDDGRKLHAFELDSVPVFDALIAARGRLYMATADGRVICLAPQP